ncbi:MAG: metallophosphoesterase [Oscillospiraceae bacterium]|jgi:predicted MPP superfamily phosphohydrolase|nr:metallophosphoesterase [Oscillospiraceae bacterium]
MKGIILLSVLTACFVWLYWGNTSIQTTKITICSEKIPVPFQGFVIVQVSDLHNAEFGHGQSKLLHAVKAASPNLIAVTGDLVDSRHTDFQKAMEFIDGAVKIAPVYYVTGNHEARIDAYPEFEKKLVKAGVVVLRNQSKRVERNGEYLRVLGLDEPDFIAKGNANKRVRLVDTTLKNTLSDRNSYTILLAHRPELFDEYASNRIDLVLSGHAHGGQVRLPFAGGLVAPGQGLFPRYDGGVYESGQTQMVVSRGLGNSIAPVRVNNRPELAVITLQPGEQPASLGGAGPASP